MTRPVIARVAGGTFLLYIAVKVASSILFEGSIEELVMSRAFNVRHNTSGFRFLRAVAVPTLAYANSPALSSDHAPITRQCRLEKFGGVPA